ncbi:MAG: aldolase/citrate lyase family protein [Pseudomonadota bacterium]
MNTPAKITGSSFARALRGGELLVGTFVKTPSPVICEVLCATPLDVLALDAEHAPFGRRELDECLAITHLKDQATLVRVPDAAPAQLLNALDCGATGVLVPHVTSAREAAAVTAASHFGRGGRGYAGSTRAADFGKKSIPDHLRSSAERTAVVAQIEDVEALEDIDAIAAVDGIDCLFVGRIDLTVALGADRPDAPQVLEAVESICAAAQRAGRAVGMFVGDLGEIPHWREQGASLFLLASDHAFLHQGAASLVQTVKGA